MTGEFRTFGPPGTGKTTRLATRDIPRAIEKYGEDKIMVVSFTKTAALKIAAAKSLETGLSIGLPDANVGTLHSICFAALNAPKIIETEKSMIAHWNEKYQHWAITGQLVSSLDEVVDEFSGAGAGDKMLNVVNIFRNKLVDQRYWQNKVINFYRAWCEFKKEAAAYDFTDLISVCLDTRPYAPMRPKVIFVDEAQDFTKLQLKLIRSWSFDCDWIILVGDDDQCIYKFSGATPDAFLDPPVPENMKTVLKQSYRVPQKILERATKLIEKVKTREPKTYAARRDKNGQTVAGRVREHTANWKHPEELVLDCKQYVQTGKSVMFLASCSYMLDPLKAVLKEQGLAFHNPYRKKRFDWNPLGSAGNGVSGAQLVEAFLSEGIDERYWNVPDFIRWAKFIKVGPTGLRRKYGKAGISALTAAIENNEPGLHTTREVLGDLLEADAIEPALARDVNWLHENLTPRRKAGVVYPLKVLKRCGIEALARRPEVLIGTVHSVKGEEADAVYLFPDLSWQAHDEMQRNRAGAESIYRVFYVGMTRAACELILCAPATIGGHGQKPKLFVEL